LFNPFIFNISKCIFAKDNVITTIVYLINIPFFCFIGIKSIYRKTYWSLNATQLLPNVCEPNLADKIFIVATEAGCKNRIYKNSPYLQIIPEGRLCGFETFFLSLILCKFLKHSTITRKQLKNRRN